MNKILLVEDDQNLGYILREYLQMHQFNVHWVPDGEQALQAFHKEPFDIAILDVMMPKKDGFSTAADIKAHQPHFPVIFLTARSLKVDKLKGFKLGCDDYIVKPVDEEELIARIQAVLNRSKKADTQPETFRFGAYTFHPHNQTLTIQETTQTLTQKESKILHLLCTSIGQLIESDQILKALWGENNYFNRRSMDVFISKLRKYLSHDPHIHITNVHGKGYILEENQ